MKGCTILSITYLWNKNQQKTTASKILVPRSSTKVSLKVAEVGYRDLYKQVLMIIAQIINK